MAFTFDDKLGSAGNSGTTTAPPKNNPPKGNAPSGGNNSVLNNSQGFSTFEGPGGTTVADFGDGIKVVIPEEVDFGSLEAPFINFGKALETALKYGVKAKDTYFQDINDSRSKDTALGLIDTDITGIKKGINELAPLAIDYGNRDTGINISRAGQIDRANINRIPEFNRFNESQVADINRFNAGEHQTAVEASGLDYSNRITQILNQLGVQSTGQLSDPLLNTLITSTARNTGADIGSSTGITGLSRSGQNVQDRLDVNQRISLALDAQKTLPAVLTQGQQVLQPPTLQYSGVLASPTGIPLNPSNIGDRIPLTSNVSAGQAQLQIGTNVAQLETIPAGQVLQSGIQAAEYNATGAFNTELTKLSMGQAQLQAVDSAVQSGYNQQLATDIRNQQYAQFQAGQNQAQQSANIQAGASVFGSIAGALLSTPSGGGTNPIVSGIMNGAGNILQAAGNTVGSVIDGISSVGGQILGTSSGKLEFGNTQIDGSSIKSFFGGVKDFFTGTTSSGGGGGAPASVGGQAVVGSAAMPNGDPGYQLADGQVVAQSGGGEGFMKQMSSALSDSGVDSRVLSQSANTAVNWDKLTPPQQMQSAGSIAVDVLQNKGLITEQQAQTISTSQNALMTLANPDSTPSQRATALLAAGASATTLPYTGAVNAPTTVNGQEVLQSTVTSDGQPGFQLANGEVVPQSSILTTSNAVSGVQAFGVLTDPNATTEQKTLALTSIGVHSATANNIVSQVAGGNIAAGLAVINTAANWNDMAPVQQAASILQTSHAVMNGLSAAGVGGKAATTGASILGGGPTAASSLPGGATLGGITAGAYTGYLQLQGVKNFLSGKNLSGKEQAALFLPTFGMSVFAKPIKKLFDGAFGSGKNSEQKARDSWREGLTKVGLAEKEDGTQFVSLSDGSKYNIGVDGGEKFKNVDGTERFSFDVDWGNQAAVNNIPAAHIFAIASGLDPTSNQEKDLFTKAVGQALNAASSNASTTDGIRSNFAAMMEKADPTSVAMRLETLRAVNKISDQEYGVYVNTLNQTFGTQFSPLDRAKSLNYILQSLEGQSSLSKEDKELLELLNNEKELTKNKEELDKRVNANA